MKTRAMMTPFVLVFLLAAPSGAADEGGQVWFGQNLAKPLSGHTDRLYLRIGDSNKLYFNRPHDGPVAENLDLHRDYRIKVYFDDRIVQSWTLNFSELKTRSVIIWRSSGSWHMDPLEPSPSQ